MDDLEHLTTVLFIDVAVIMVVARLAGMAARKVRQPAVVGEIIGGILMGPTLLGGLPGNLPDRLFPTEVRPFLTVVAQLGLILFMFVVGLEVDPALVRGKERVAAVISLSSVALPFGLGFGLAYLLYANHDTVEGSRVGFLAFALFIGASMCITAFPVLARILTERKMYRTPVGALTLACAAVDDILAWTLLAVVIAVAQSTGLGALPVILAESVAFVALMFLLVRPLLGRLVVDRYRRAGQLTPDVLSVVLVGILASSYVTSEIGIHAIFGAFLFGVVIPRQDTATLFRDILERIEPVTVLLLLPVFFIATGLNVDLRSVDLAGLRELGLILLVACAGKFLGASAAAKAQGLPGRQSAAIGTLMNTRGLTELVILNVGREVGVLDGQLFTLLVTMAVITTVITEPVLRLIYPDRLLERDIADAEREALSIPDVYRVQVAVGEPIGAPALIDAALALVGDERPAEVVLTRFAPLAGGGEVSGGLDLVAELAGMAGALGPLEELAGRVRERGVPCTVLSRLSSDVAADLIDQATSLETDVLLIAEHDRSMAQEERRGLIARLMREAPCDVVLVDRRGYGLRTAARHPIVVPEGGAARTWPHRS